MQPEIGTPQCANKISGKVQIQHAKLASIGLP
jgi:hypothetical protein